MSWIGKAQRSERRVKGKNEQERDWASMQVTGVSSLGRVDVSVSVNLSSGLHKHQLVKARRKGIERLTQITHAFGYFFMVPEIVPIA